MAYADFKDLARRTASDKVLRDKAFNIAKNPKYDEYQRGLASMVYKFFVKKSKGDTNYIYKNELDEACFQHDMAYGDFKDLARRIASDKNLRNKAFNIAKNLKYDGYQSWLASIVYKFFDKKCAGSGVKGHLHYKTILL